MFSRSSNPKGIPVFTKAVVLSALIVSHPVGSVTEYDVSSPDSAVVR